MGSFFLAFFSSMMVKVLPPFLRRPTAEEIRIEETRQLQEKVQSMDSRTLIVFDLSMRQPSNDAALPGTALAAREHLLERLKSPEQSQAILKILAPTLHDALGEALNRAKDKKDAAHFLDACSVIVGDNASRTYKDILNDFFIANAQGILELGYYSTKEIVRLDAYTDRVTLSFKMLEEGLAQAESAADFMPLFRDIAEKSSESAKKSLYYGFLAARAPDIWDLDPSIEQVKNLFRLAPHWNDGFPIFLKKGMRRAMKQTRTADTFFALLNLLERTPYGRKTEDIDKFLTENAEVIFKFDLSFNQMESISHNVSSQDLLAILRRRKEILLLGDACRSDTAALVSAGK